MSKKNTLTTRTILYTVSKFLSQGINAITAFVFVRLLTTEQYGYVSVYSAWVSLVSVFISLRTDGTIQMARTKYGKEKVDQYASCALAISTLVFAGVLFVLLLLGLCNSTIFSKPYWYIVLVLLHSFGSACLKFRSAYYAIAKEAFKDMVVSLLVSVLSFGSALFLVLIMPANKEIGRILGFALTNLLLGVIFLVIMFLKGKCFYNREYYRFCCKLAFPLIFSGLSSVIISQADRLMLEGMVGAEATAIYSFGFNVVMPISVIWYALNHAWVPEYHEMMKKNETEKVFSCSRNYMFVFTCLSSGYVLISNEMLILLGTEEYYSAKYILPLMTLYYYLQFLYTFPINYEFYKNNTKLLGVAMTMAAIINVVLNLWLIPMFQIAGALIASIVASVFMFVFHEYNARFVLKGYHYKISFYLYGIVPFVVTLLLAYLFMDSMLIRWILACVWGCVLLKYLLREKKIF